MLDSLAMLRKIAPTCPDTLPAGAQSRKAVARALWMIFVAAVGDERVEGATTIGLDGLVPTGGRLKHRLPDGDRDHVLTRTGLELPRRAGTVRRDPGLDVDRIGVITVFSWEALATSTSPSPSSRKLNASHWARFCTWSSHSCSSGGILTWLSGYLREPLSGVSAPGFLRTRLPRRDSDSVYYSRFCGIIIMEYYEIIYDA